MNRLTTAEIAALVRAERLRAGLSKMELARRAMLTDHTVRDVEWGVHGCRVETLLAILDVFGKGLEVVTFRPGGRR